LDGTWKARFSKLPVIILVILGQVKMNFKYLPMICEAIKYGMVKAQVVLDYVERRLTSKNGELNMLATLK
jgi:hypothetical protein